MSTDHCHRCLRETPTVLLLLSSGHVGRVCKVCRTCRHRRPYATKSEYEHSLTATRPEGEHARRNQPA
jgi:hypothetical protein